MKVIGDEGHKLFQGVENIQYCTSRISYFYVGRKDSRNHGCMNEGILLLCEGMEIAF